MEIRSKELVPFKVTHPGEVLLDELKERGIRSKEFAVMIGIQASHLNEFIKGKRNLNYELAVKLERHIGIPFEVWMNLQRNYREDSGALEARTSQR